MALQLSGGGVGRLCVLYQCSLRRLCRLLARPVSSSAANNNNNSDDNDAPDSAEADQAEAVALASQLSTSLSRSGDFLVGHGGGDKRTPLPGNVGLAEQLAPSISVRRMVAPPIAARQRRRDISGEFYEDRRAAALLTYLSPLPDLHVPDALQDRGRELVAARSQLEITAHHCPDLLKQDFRALFTERDILTDTLTVLVVNQRTKHDMLAWSQAVEQERAQLATHFLYVGRDVSLRLRQLGFWADLIDPRSGRPHLSAFIPSTGATGSNSGDIYSNADDADCLLETDDRLAALGFQIEDMGCCKVVRHSHWGSHVFVGCMFTNAPVDSGQLSSILRGYQALTSSEEAE